MRARFPSFTRVSLVLACLVLLVSACDRPFVERAPATFEVVSPQDPSAVIAQRSVTVSIEVSSSRNIQRVQISGEAMHFDEQNAVWVDTLQLRTGLNRFPLTAYDAQEVAGRDTLYLAHAQHALNTVTGALPDPRGGHAAARIPGSALLIAGGAEHAGGSAQNDAYLLPTNQLQAQRLNASLQVARTGHTATALPDGRVLLLGGSTTDDPSSAAALVEAAELYDPESRTFSRVPLQGTGVQRTLHTAFLLEHDPPVVAVYGGQGHAGAEPDSRLAPRRDLRRFLLRNDSLIALDPDFGPLLPSVSRRLSGHTQTALGSAPASEYFVAGAVLNEQDTASVTFRLLTPAIDDVDVRPAPPLHMLRTRHAAAPFQDELVWLFGGHQPGRVGTRVLRSVELHAPRIQQAFHLPPGDLPAPRYALTATKRAEGRILLLGGFSPDGSGRSYATFFTISR